MNLCVLSKLFDFIPRPDLMTEQTGVINCLSQSASLNSYQRLSQISLNAVDQGEERLE